MVDEIVEQWPDRCGSCQREFSACELVDAEEPSRHQLAELPPIAVRVSEHRLHWVCCPACAAVTTATPPAARWAFGPRLQAAIVTLAVRNRVSRRQTTELARELFGVELATGTVDAIVQRAGEALAAPQTRLEQEIKRSPVVNIDETGWKTKGERRTLWAALTSETAVFRIAAGRHASEAAMLGSRGGVESSPTGYEALRLPRASPPCGSCWARLLGDFTAHSEGMGEQAQFGAAGLAVATDLFNAWQQFQQDGNRAQLRRRTRPLQTRLRARARARLPQEHPYQVPPPVRPQPAQTLARPLDLTHTDGVEPTNNHAERGLRGAVIHRKLSLGSQSDRGEQSAPTTPLRLNHLPAPPPIPLRLPHPSHHRPRPRRPNTQPQLTATKAERLQETLD